MEFLGIQKGKIVTSSGAPIRLRGFNVGGWMNMEDFINGFAGNEEGVRRAVAAELGQSKADFYFNKMMDYLFCEEDVIFMKQCGANSMRLPLNYRHFEDDDAPFVYKESGFERLDRALGWCEKHGLYAILDLHSVQGYQNTDWHCDNACRHSFLWRQKQHQDRFVALWEEFARRYRGRAVVAGYDIMNEPIANASMGRFYGAYTPDWQIFNSLYRRAAESIRAIDEKHIIFLEGDDFSRLFDGMEAPFADNLAYSSHNYIESGLNGPYPGFRGGPDPVWWDKEKQRQVFLTSEGTVFTQKHNRPLWVSEFGSVYNGPAEEIPDRLRSLDDHLSLFAEYGAHWSIWTYKDLGVMSAFTVSKDSDYVQLMKPILEQKEQLNIHFGVNWLPANESRRMVSSLADYIGGALNQDPADADANRRYLAQTVFSCYAAVLMQPLYAKRLKGMSEGQLDSVLSSYALKNCVPNQGLIDLLKKHMATPD